METVANYLARERRSDRPALVDAAGRAYDAHWLCTSAWKAGNFLRHTGVRRGVTVGVVGNGPLAILSFLGTALLSGRSWFDPPSSIAGIDEMRTLVAPADRLNRYDVGPSTQRVCYGADPPTPDVHHLDTGLWSENPSFPPIDVDPETPLLATTVDDGCSSGTISHGEAIASAQSTVDEYDIDEGTRVVVQVPFTDPRAIVAGILVPLIADGVTVLPDLGDAGDATVNGDVYLTETASSVPDHRLPLEETDFPAR